MPWWPVLFVVTTFSSAGEVAFPGASCFKRRARIGGVRENAAVCTVVTSGLETCRLRRCECAVMGIPTYLAGPGEFEPGKYCVRSTVGMADCRVPLSFPRSRCYSSLPDRIVSPAFEAFAYHSFVLTGSHAAGSVFYYSFLFFLFFPKWTSAVLMIRQLFSWIFCPLSLQPQGSSCLARLCQCFCNSWLAANEARTASSHSKQTPLFGGLREHDGSMTTLLANA